MQCERCGATDITEGSTESVGRIDYLPLVSAIVCIQCDRFIAQQMLRHPAYLAIKRCEAVIPFYQYATEGCDLDHITQKIHETEQLKYESYRELNIFVLELIKPVELPD